MKKACSCARWNSARDPMPKASAPYALPWAISARIRLVPSCAAVTFMQPRASRMVTTSGFSFFSTPFASAASRILRATSRVNSAINLFLWIGGWVGFRIVEAHGQHARDVDRLARGAVPDLVPAGGAVGHDERIGV